MDSLWEAAGSELKDWDCMTTLLLQEDGEDSKSQTLNNPKFVFQSIFERSPPCM